MINAVTFHIRKNKESKFEKCIIFTKHAFSQIDSSYGVTGSIEALVNSLTSKSLDPENIEAEISVIPTNAGDEVVASPVVMRGDNRKMNEELKALEKKVSLLTRQELRVLKLILRHFRQKEICEKLNIKLNTEKGYRKLIHCKLEIKNFSELTEHENQLLLDLTKEI